MYLREKLTNSGFSDIGNWQSEVSLAFQGNQVLVFFANDKIQAFKEKLEFWKLEFAITS